MEYNKRNIKGFKGRLITIRFIPKKYGVLEPHELTGEISYELFRV